MRLIAATRVTMLHRRLLAQQQLIEGEVELAAGIQRGLFPAAPPQVPGLALAGRCLPAANVGGDYYDYVEDLGGRLTVLVADVAGHSIGSALMVAMARSLLRREISEGSGPAAVLRSVNEAMFRDLVNAELFITMFCARYEPDTHTLLYANAGHNPPLLRRAGEASTEVDADGAAVGFFERFDFQEVELELAPNDALMLYTDGIVEALNPEGEQYGEQRLREVIDDSDPDPSELTGRVLDAVRAHTCDAPPQDDMTLVGLQVLGS
jgi:sigma-B regulation protein RsbU (phosphoserine phosphatase)